MPIERRSTTHERENASDGVVRKLNSTLQIARLYFFIQHMHITESYTLFTFTYCIRSARRRIRPMRAVLRTYLRRTGYFSNEIVAASPIRTVEEGDPLFRWAYPLRRGQTPAIEEVLNCDKELCSWKLHKRSLALKWELNGIHVKPEEFVRVYKFEFDANVCTFRPHCCSR